MKTDYKKLIRMIILIVGCFVMKMGSQSNVKIIQILGVVSAIITMIIGVIILKECVNEWRNWKK